jgi:antitoxin component HigA of HigAB toxin-antitoxin module
MTDLNKLNEIIIKDEKWLHEAKNRQINNEWKSYSIKIASKILIILREKNMKQNQLAEIIGISEQQVNNIVKGKENLTLKIIAKLENALDIKLILFD